MVEKRVCFGTTEYSEKSFICKKCPDYEDCGKFFPKKFKKKVKVKKKKETEYKF